MLLQGFSRERLSGSGATSPEALARPTALRPVLLFNLKKPMRSCSSRFPLAPWPRAASNKHSVL